MTCTNCGNTVPDGGNCPYCGTAAQSSSMNAPAPYPGKNMGMISMILGIVAAAFSTIFAWMPGSNLAPIAAVAGLVLGILAQKESKVAGFKNTMATTGVITSAIALALQLCILALAVLLVVAYVVIYMLFFVGVMSAASAPYYYYY